ncbi:MAG TPA: VOC family protein [Pararhizobium sp.]|nr:VOC family protein [Pararhizobium sp.]
MNGPAAGSRPIDHCVLPVADLAAARVRLARLGFTVAPEARHPFGTKNACVFFADGTYLEPLAVAEREACEAAAKAGNVFVARDHAFRFRNGEDGFSALAFSTLDAAADDEAFRRAGISAGEPLEFARPFQGPSGETAEAGFRLAFAADLRAPDVLFFTCERVNAPAIDRSALERHANAVTGIAEIMLAEQNPADFQYFLQEVIRQRNEEASSFGLTLRAANAKVSVLTPEGMEARLGESVALPVRGLRLAAIVFAVRDLAIVERQLRDEDILFRRHGRRIVVAAAPGQSAIFVFEEA